MLKINDESIDNFLRNKSENEKTPIFNEEDRKHSIIVNRLRNEILSKINPNQYNYIHDKLNAISDEYMRYLNYYSDTDYRDGFNDCFNYIISTLGGNDVK